MRALPLLSLRKGVLGDIAILFMMLIWGTEWFQGCHCNKIIFIVRLLVVVGMIFFYPLPWLKHSMVSFYLLVSKDTFLSAVKKRMVQCNFFEKPGAKKCTILLHFNTNSYVKSYVGSALNHGGALAESPHASGNNHYSGSPSVPSLSPTMQHRYKVTFILIETAENSSRSPPNTTLASAAALFDSYEWIPNPNEVSQSHGP